MEHAKYALIIAATLFINGCASYQFKEMSPERRAVKVCYANKHIKDINAKCNKLAESVSETETLLKRGFKTINRCEWYEVEDAVKTVCNDDDENDCHQVLTYKRYKDCHKVNTAIDIDDEQKSLEDKKEKLTICRQHLLTQKAVCMDNASKMSSEEAYSKLLENQDEDVEE